MLPRVYRVIDESVILLSVMQFLTISLPVLFGTAIFDRFYDDGELCLNGLLK